MEPIDGARDLCDREHEGIPAAQVGQLVLEHGVKRGITPVAGNRRQQNLRAHDAAGQRNRDVA